MLVFYLSRLETEESKSKFTLLYEKYIKLMHFVAYKILLDEQLSEDAVHNAFIKLVNYLDTIEDIECHKTKNFIVIIVRSAALDLYRKRKRQSTVPFEEVEFTVQSDNEIDEYTDVGILKETIKVMPDTLRDVLELKYFYGNSNLEIAKTLSISEETVRKRLERAREKLSSLLEMEGNS